MIRSPGSCHLSVTALITIATTIAIAIGVNGLTPACFALERQPSSAQQKIAPQLLGGPANERQEVQVLLREQADLTATRSMHTQLQKGTYVFEQLSAVAERTQGRLRAQLDERRIDYRAFWIVNMLRVDATPADIIQMALLPEVARIEPDATLDIARPQRSEVSEMPRSGSNIEWHVDRVLAQQVWNAGVTGVGAVVGSMDTGFEWSHPALIRQYRGNARGIVDHSYNWHDAIYIDQGPCGPQSLEPCDADGHGTLTMGMSVGDDGFGNQIGVAPGAQWIGCRCWEPKQRTHLSYVMECFEWFIAPTDINDANPDPSKAPHVINNSWICEANEGCEDPLALQMTVENVRAAGILVVASAGNSGEFGCESVFDPPAIYEAAFTVGSTDLFDSLSPFSSRGPVGRDGSGRTKPDIVAPGQNVRSSDLHGTYMGGVNGTSLAGPIVAGTVALIISAVPSLAGDVDAIEQILTSSATPLLATGSCGGVSNQSRPNNMFGWGRVDAWSAYRLAKSRETGIDDEYDEETEGEAVLQFRLFPNRPNPFNPSTQITYEIPRLSQVSLQVYDAMGRRVRTLVDRATRAAGRFSIEWDGRSDENRPLGSGVYFARLESDGRVLASRRLTLVR